MPVPSFTGLPPKPTFDDVTDKINTIIKELTNLLLNLDFLNVVQINAEAIDTGTLDAGRVTVRSDLKDGAYIVINNNGMTISDGTQNTFSVDINGKVTMTGAKIQTTVDSYPRVEINEEENIILVYTNPQDYMRIVPGETDAPAIEFYEDGQLALTVGTYLGFPQIEGVNGVSIHSGANIVINCGPSGQITVNGWNQILGVSNAQTLQQALNQKANASSYSGSFVAGTKTVNVVNGVITSVV